jgi:TonB family protein
MPRDARFWRNVAIIAIAHLVVLLALARAGRHSGTIESPSIVWMNSGAIETAATNPSPPPAAADPPPSIPPPPEERDEPAPSPSTRSEIELPSPTPAPTSTPKPKPSPTPSASPKPSPKPTPKPAPKKTGAASPTPAPSPKKKNAEKKEGKENEKKPAVKEAPAKTAGPSDPAPHDSSETGPGTGNGSTRSSEFAWYGAMLHDRFHKEWEQPTTIVATGAKTSTLVKIRIEKDGRVSKFTIVKPSGNVVVDESVAAVAPKVTQVDPLPAGLIKGPYYEVQINFELNPEK